jgi:hypothetical protein
MDKQPCSVIGQPYHHSFATISKGEQLSGMTEASVFVCVQPDGEVMLHSPGVFQ